MKKILLLGFVLFCFLFSSCSTLNCIVYSDKWAGYSYDKVFNAALYALNTSSQGATIIETNRNSGIIRTANSCYLITPAANSLFIYYSTHMCYESVKYDTDKSDIENTWLDKQKSLFQDITNAYEMLNGSTQKAESISEEKADEKAEAAAKAQVEKEVKAAEKEAAKTKR